MKDSKRMENMIDKAVEVLTNKLGCHWADSEAVFNFKNGKQAIVKRTKFGEHLELLFDGQVLYNGSDLSNYKTVAYDLIVLGYENA